MNSKLIGTVLVVGSLGAAVWLFVAQHQSSIELVQLRTENQALRDAPAAPDEPPANKGTAETNEVAQLRKENEDLLRLRNEVRQLREENQQLGRQVQTAQGEAQQARARVQNAQAQMQALQTAAQAATNQPIPLVAGTPEGVFTKEQLEMRRRYGIAMDAASETAACINNLRQLDGAKQQWALEKAKPATAVPQLSDLAPYLRNANLACPAGGTYTLNPVSTVPTCTQPGHALGN